MEQHELLSQHELLTQHELLQLELPPLEHERQLPEHNKDEYIEILYNASFGGEYTISDEAQQLYIEHHIDFRHPDHDFFDDFEDRQNVLLIQIYHQLESKFSGKSSHIKVKRIPKIYENHFHIHEYNGFESIIINYSQYEVNLLLRNFKHIILHPTLTNDAKILRLIHLCS